MVCIRKGIVMTLACVALGVIALMTCACSGTQDTTQASSASSRAESSSTASAPDAVGLAVPAIGAGDTTVQVTNETGYDVIGIKVKSEDEASYPTANSFDGFVFEDGSTIDLSFTRTAGEDDYDVLLLTSEDSKIAVRDIELAGLRDITFRFEEGIGYITYTDATTGKTLDNRADAMDEETDAPTVPYDLETQRG